MDPLPHITREPHMAPLQPHMPSNPLQHLHHLQQQHHHQQQHATGSAIVDTFLQFIAENSGLTPEQAAAYASAHAKMAQMSGFDKLGARGVDDYPIIGRDPLTEDRHPPLSAMDAESSAGEEDDFSESEDHPEALKAE